MCERRRTGIGVVRSASGVLGEHQQCVHGKGLLKPITWGWGSVVLIIILYMLCIYMKLKESYRF